MTWIPPTEDAIKCSVCGDLPAHTSTHICKSSAFVYFVNRFPMRDEENKRSFVQYLEDHPDERLWQAIRNWSGTDTLIWPSGEQKPEGMTSTFYLEGEKARGLR